MLGKRAIRLSFLTIIMLVVGAYPAFAQQTGEQTQQPVPQPAPPQAAETASPQPDGEAQQQGQNLAVGNPSHDAAVTLFFGGLVGGDLVNVLQGDFSLAGTLENGRTYGGRIGYYPWPLGVEGSFTYSDSGLAAEISTDNARIRLGARVMYTEVNAVLTIIPGPVQPFVTGGGGLHSYKITDLQGIDLNKWGWNFGGGLKINISRVSLRADLRDHMTPNITPADLGIDPTLSDLLGMTNQTLHNVEISFGLGFSF